MYAFVTALALTAGANALITRTAPCCFHLDASGAVTGSVGQLSDGQNRVGGGLTPAQYCIADGGITDANGRGCILTRTFTSSFRMSLIITDLLPAPTSQFQCDVGASPTTGFSVGCDGTVAYNGMTTFYECQTGDNVTFPSTTEDRTDFKSGRGQHLPDSRWCKLRRDHPQGRRLLLLLHTASSSTTSAAATARKDLPHQPQRPLPIPSPHYTDRLFQPWQSRRHLLQRRSHFYHLLYF